MGGGGGEKIHAGVQGALTAPDPAFLTGLLASELSLIACSKKKNHYWGPHNLVWPGAPTRLNPALITGLTRTNIC